MVDHPSPEPTHAVVIHNDDDHSYRYVIDVLKQTIGCDAERALELATQVDKQGSAVVSTGTLQAMELKRDLIRHFGTDYYGPPVHFPLRVSIEPLAE